MKHTERKIERRKKRASDRSIERSNEVIDRGLAAIGGRQERSPVLPQVPTHVYGRGDRNLCAVFLPNCRADGSAAAATPPSRAIGGMVSGEGHRRPRPGGEPPPTEPARAALHSCRALPHVCLRVMLEDHHDPERLRLAIAIAVGREKGQWERRCGKQGRALIGRRYGRDGSPGPLLR